MLVKPNVILSCHCTLKWNSLIGIISCHDSHAVRSMIDMLELFDILTSHLSRKPDGNHTTFASIPGFHRCFIKRQNQYRDLMG